MKYCVITKVSDKPSEFADDLIFLRGRYWCYYPWELPDGFYMRNTPMKAIKVQPYSLGEILVLDKNEREMVPHVCGRKPGKWGVEAKHAPSSWRGMEYELFNNAEEAINQSKEILDIE